MGCDIHLYCEAYTTVKDVKAWRCVDLFEYDYWDNNFKLKHAYSDRNYALFTALADVRNYGNGVVPMGQPKGVPEDMSEHVHHEYLKWEGDGHSHSWWTLQDLYNYQDQHDEIIYKGIVSPEDAKAIDEGWVYPWKVKGDILKNLIEKVELRAKDVLWEFENDRVPQEKAERFRIVFWFDN